MKILNLGCGTKVSSNPQVINMDWSISVRVKKSRLLRPFVPVFIKGERRRKYDLLNGNIMAHDLSKGIPFDSNTTDVVYQSHLLEHLDKDDAVKFLLEIERVLKPGGIHRIVVPDFERVCKAYLSHLVVCEKETAEVANHDTYIAAIIEQSVTREASGTSQQPPVRRFIENCFLGDARKRGETHQWMYDRFNLSCLLTKLGYKALRLQQYNTSSIPNWNDFGLDLNEDGNEYKPGSLYMEVEKR